MRILVAGALGEVGRTLSWALVERGHEVVPASSRAPDAASVAISYAQAADLVCTGSIDLVVNAAGRGDRRDHPRTGLDATAALGDAMRGTAVPAVLISTTRVLEGYGATAGESDPPAPTTVYGQANAMNESTWLAATGDSGRVLRIANYFCAPSSRAAPQAGLLPWSLVTEAVDSGRIVVRSCPGTTREFVSADDVAAAIEILATERPMVGIVATTPGVVLRLADLVEATSQGLVDAGLPRPIATFGTLQTRPPTCEGTWLAERGWRAQLDAPTISACITGWLKRGCLD